MALDGEAAVIDVGSYCRQIEAYLCAKNGGHLIRIVGPAFETVSRWWACGISIKIVFRGIDRRTERLADRGGRRRPVRIEFCEADILDLFDGWKRAVGTLANLSAGEAAPQDLAAPGHAPARGPSLRAHLERVQVRLTGLLARQRLPDGLQQAIDHLCRRLEEWHRDARTRRGDSRARLLDDLRLADTSLMDAAWSAQDHGTLAALREEAASDLAPFRGRMTEETWRVSVDAAARRLLRETLGLPTIALD